MNRRNHIIIIKLVKSTVVCTIYRAKYCQCKCLCFCDISTIDHIIFGLLLLFYYYYFFASIHAVLQIILGINFNKHVTIKCIQITENLDACCQSQPVTLYSTGQFVECNIKVSRAHICTTQPIFQCIAKNCFFFFARAIFYGFFFSSLY